MMCFDEVFTGYDGTAVVTGVTGSFQPGQITGIVGPNGSGKTTLLKCAAGLLPLLSGSLSLSGQSLTGMNRRTIARQVAYLPQGRAVLGISVKSLVAHGRYPHMDFGRTLTRLDLEKIDAAMEMADVYPLRERPVKALSGGERQRAYIAMILAQDAPLMLLDEPTASLDMSSQFALMEMLEKLRVSVKTIALVIHELPLAMDTCDTLWVMREGRVVRQGKPASLYEEGTLSHAFGVRVQYVAGHYIFTKKDQT